MSYQLIQVSEKFDGAVAQIELGPPPANIICAALIKELLSALEEIPTDPQKKMIILTGLGKHFSFGASVEEHAPGAVDDMLPQFHLLIERMLAMPLPLMAKVKGAALGGGFEVVLACNLIFAADDAKLGVPEIKLGVFPPPASILLPLKIGEVRASEMTLSGEQRKAPEWLEMGAINRVVSLESLDEVIDRFIETEILPKSASSLRFANRAVRLTTLRSYQQHIKEVESLYLNQLMATKDAVEGIQSFIEKRSAKWQNC